ncbi:hydroxypyruvate isomerase family protein [Paeniglutamicibacter cryotolerans]|uniref:Hydroxypyruvate isomerase n=1 Tax=Paeniglutamicibacter cryotolerans TaxID=670079 RepID=A0A839QJ47_9MICC|nr:TIM barrel protein [Paeniglutamicibacter cryotolerans]MBB2994565.1 hydroxypyruvate isomerase [Paeniglutamicibacter cryotolerans]
MSYTVNCSILLTELPLLQRPAAAKAAGFENVEFWWPFAASVPKDAEVDQFIAALKDAGVQLTGLNFNAGDMPAGDRGLVSWKGRCSEFKENIEIVVAIGSATGCTAFNALYGNRQEEHTPEAQDELAVENLVAAAIGVAAIGGTVLLEPVSGAARYPLKFADDALSVIAKTRAAGVQNVKLLADFYHLAVNGDDVEAVINAHAHEFGHIQIADDPGRGAPGSGTLPLGDWITRSRELGYAGHIGLEYKAAVEDAFGWLIRQNA